MIITIDGPAASGKSTVARILAAKLNIYYLYTGMFYRAVAYILLECNGYTIDQLFHPLQEDIDSILDDAYLVYSYSPEKLEQIYFKGSCLTACLKSPTIDQGASIVSTSSLVRSRLLVFQQSFGKKYNLVADGRDCGTHIFPDAEYKFFLTAQLEIRAARWQQEERELGISVDFATSRKDIAMRDYRDTNRPDAPLIVPKNAHIIDSTDLTIDQVVERMLSYIEQKEE